MHLEIAKSSTSLAIGLNQQMGQIQEHGRELPVYKGGFLCSRVQICGLDETSTKTVCWEMGNKREQTNHCRPGPLQGGDSLSYWSVILPDEGNDRCQGRRGRARVHVDAGGYHLRRARAKGWFGSRTQRPRNAYDWSGKKPHRLRRASGPKLGPGWRLAYILQPGALLSPLSIKTASSVPSNTSNVLAFTEAD